MRLAEEPNFPGNLSKFDGLSKKKNSKTLIFVDFGSRISSMRTFWSASWAL